LGEDAGIDDVPVVEVNYAVRDVATGNIINQRNKFIESLHHRSWVVQVNYLKEPRRTELELLLSVFDQDKCSSDVHIMNIKEEDFPEKYRPIIRRLKMAASSPEIKKQMKEEDIYLAYLRNLIRETEAKKDEIIAEKENIIAEKENIIAAKDEALAAKDHELAELRRLLLQSGITIPTNLD
jgi:hypothetical protein